MPEPDAQPYTAELAAAIAAARAGGQAIKPFYDNQSAATYTKRDGSPVTDADLASDRIIREQLSRQFPGDAILTEESGDDPARLHARRCWIVDPLDGTAQFIARTGEFDVMIALTVDGRPVVGATYAPAFGILCAAAAGQGSWIERDGQPRQPLHFAPLPAGKTPRLTTYSWFGVPEALVALRQLAGATGFAPPAVSESGFNARTFLNPQDRWDAIIGFTRSPDRTMASEWDFAAVDVIVQEAGGAFTNLWGQHFQYNKTVPRNIGGFLAAADPALHDRLLTALAAERAATGAR